MLKVRLQLLCFCVLLVLSLSVAAQSVLTQCGSGWFNVCDKAECSGLGGSWVVNRVSGIFGSGTCYAKTVEGAKQVIKDVKPVVEQVSTVRKIINAVSSIVTGKKVVVDSIKPDITPTTNSLSVVKYVPEVKEVVAGEAIWYDVDVVDVWISCPSCPVIDGKEVMTAGFNYILFASLSVDGNTGVASQPLSVEWVLPDGTTNTVESIVSLSPGISLVSLGTTPKIPINSFTSRMSGSESAYFTTKLSVRLLGDTHKVVQSKEFSYVETQRICEWSGLSRSCYNTASTTVKYCCPNDNICCNNDVSCLDLSKCSIPDADVENSRSRTFELSKLTATLAADANLDVGGVF